jgi:hypothetical protein
MKIKCEPLIMKAMRGPQTSYEQNIISMNPIPLPPPLPASHRLSVNKGEAR